MVKATNLGYPRIGKKRELKKSVERYWAGKSSQEDLFVLSPNLKKENWMLQKEAGLHHIPSNDFSFYDHILDTIAMVGAVPQRFNWKGNQVDMPTYFAMARGIQQTSTSSSAAIDVPAMEMTKWFDTNYHYIVPELEKGMEFHWASRKVVDEFIEAKNMGIHTRPMLIGPVSFLLLGKTMSENLETLAFLDDLLPVYATVIKELEKSGADWIQIDEPILVLDLTEAQLKACHRAYDKLGQVSSSIKILLTTYFDTIGDNIQAVAKMPVSGVHLDLVRAPDQLDKALEVLPGSMELSLGLVDGRNVWINNLNQSIQTVQKVLEKSNQQSVMIAPSCSLLHTPYDLAMETDLNPELHKWLAFAKQKIDEIAVVARFFNEGETAVKEALDKNQQAIEQRKTSNLIHNQVVKERLQAVTPSMLKRNKPFTERRKEQQAHLNLPFLPTTTIGSFPQTKEIRQMRSRFKKGEISKQEYEDFLKKETKTTIEFQEQIGLDVLVHGEFERTDMVEYFGEQLTGIAFTKYAWVQSYGSRCVRPPIIYGDVNRPEPMTVYWSTYAQSLTKKSVKGMLTGPVTILEWSFVRDDQPRSETCRQLALTIRDEVIDLEKAGINIIQIDEPALREGLPLRKAKWNEYLDWAVKAFKLSSSGVKDETQIHTHMCYAEFNDIIEAIAALDADVISIESSRSKMELLGAFEAFHYPNEIGPGVYDIHSPRIPGKEEMKELLQKAEHVLPKEHIWVNPDCGLKTRTWDEVKPSLTNMVEAAKALRSEQ